MEKKMDEIIERVYILEQKNYNHDELGLANGFHEAEQAKNEFCKYLKNLLEQYKSYIKSFSIQLIKDFIEKTSKIVGNLEAQLNNVEAMVKDGINNNEFPNKRTRMIKKIIENNRFLENEMHLYESKLYFQKFDEIDPEQSILKMKEEQLNILFNEVKTKDAEISKILRNVRDKMINKGLEEATGTFDHLRSNHINREKYWFWTMIIFGIIASLLVILFFLYHPTNIETKDLLVLLLKKITLISIVAVFFKIALTRNNLERNLRIIYDHRSTVLEQYKVFENAIGDDENAKNQFRLEIAKYIFSDPESGYLKQSKHDKISVNPIIQLAEKLSAQK